MSEHGSKDLQYAIFFGVVLVVGLLAVFDPFGTASQSRRTIGGLAFGPFMIGYAFLGLSKGQFPELSKGRREVSPIQFWFCFLVFLVSGCSVTWLGLKALTLT